MQVRIVVKALGHYRQSVSVLTRKEIRGINILTLLVLPRDSIYRQNAVQSIPKHQ